MMSYYALPTLLRIALMLGLFLILCGNICMLPLTFRRKSPCRTILTLLCVLFSGGMMILFSADVRIEKYSLAPSPASRWLCEKPILIITIIFAVMAVFLVYSAVREMRLRRTMLTRSAIKESIDHLTTGLCFYAENGRVMLVNHRMNQLCHTMLGRDLQNAALMWQELSSGDMQPAIVRLSMGNHPSFRLPDNTVWTFSQEKLHGVFQITAADTTQLHLLTQDLKQKNIALAALHLRLKKYEENVAELTRFKERLETKARIHSELGQALLVTRSYLLDMEGKKQVPFSIWKRCIAMLRMEAEGTAAHASLQMIIQTANAFGVTVEVSGQIPQQQTVNRLFIETAAEALTNAVRHADAKTLYIRVSETDTHYVVSIQNDGRLPDGPVSEGGGLNSLCRKAEAAGGSMRVDWQPAYRLTLSAAKRGGDKR